MSDSGLEITKAAMDEFRDIQKYMTLAKKENAKETYAEMKSKYLYLKALLIVAGVNRSEERRVGKECRL